MRRPPAGSGAWPHPSGTWDGSLFDEPSTLRVVAGPRLYQVFRGGWTWLVHESKAPTSASLAVRSRAWPRGFYAESALLCDLAHREMSEYVSDYRQLQTSAWCNLWDGLLTHRLFVRSHLRVLRHTHVETLAYIYDGHILLDPFGPEAKTVEPPQLDSELRARGVECVLRPEDSRGTQARSVLECRDGVVIPPDLTGPVLIDRRLQLGRFWRDLYPDTTNTVRLLTLWTPGTAAPFIASAVLKIGTSASIPGAEWVDGGICAPVSLQGGSVGPGRAHPSGSERHSAAPVVEYHPETGAPIAGLVIPSWDDITSTVLRIAASTPFNAMCTWDVAVDAEGSVVVAEMGRGDGMGLLQIEGGLLRDARVRQFFESYR